MHVPTRATVVRAQCGRRSCSCVAPLTFPVPDSLSLSHSHTHSHTLSPPVLPPTAQLVYVAFDMLYDETESLINLPLRERQRRLAAAIMCLPAHADGLPLGSGALARLRQAGCIARNCALGACPRCCCRWRRLNTGVTAARDWRAGSIQGRIVVLLPDVPVPLPIDRKSVV